MLNKNNKKYIWINLATLNTLSMEKENVSFD